MRLSSVVLKKSKKAVLESFGNVDIYLFGSRVDDAKRGGDIDLAIDVELSRLDFRKKKIKMMRNLLLLDFDMKIDLVPLNTKDLFFKEQILSHGIKI